MKMLARILILASFAALPLFATDEPKPPADKPAEEKEITLEEKVITLEEQEVTQEVTEEKEAKEVEEVAFFAEDKKDDYADCGCGKKREATNEQKEGLNFAFAEDKKDEAKDDQKEDSLLV